MPFPAGQSWVIGQGYNTRPTDGGSHYDCNPTTLKDAPTGSETCRSYYRYRFAIDMARADGNTVGQPALAPAAGTITWTEDATGGGVLNLGDGYAFAFFHLQLDPAIVAGAHVTAGQRLGTVAPPGEANNDGWPHLHVTLWQSSDGGNWDRNSTPFSGAHPLGGYNFPDQGTTVWNQWRNTALTSSNTDRGGTAATPTPATPTAAPATPVQVSPANSSAITRANPTVAMTWKAVGGATSYQVVLDDGKTMSPWVSGTTWTTPVLSSGQHIWQVRARNSAGQSALSVKWLLFINSSGVPTATALPTASPSGSVGSSSGVTVLPIGGGATTTITITMTGGGFAANEPVRITRDSVSGPTLTAATANGRGDFSTTFTLGDAVRGAHTLVARGQSSGRQYSAVYTVAPALARTPLNGPPGTTVTVTARGFTASETVRLTWITPTGPILAEARTDSNGTAAASFPLPDAAQGWHDYTGLGLTSGARAWGNFGIDPALTLSPSTATTGQLVTAAAHGYPAGQAVSFTWNSSVASSGSPLCTATSNANGIATCPFAVPGGSGAFPVTATSGSVSKSASLSVGGGLAVTISPTTGVVGSAIQISAGGFAAGEPVALKWDTGTSAGQTTSSAGGTVSQLVTVPFLGYGGHTLTARGQTSGRSASAIYQVGQSVSITPSSGTSGTSISISLQGMPANTSATAYWNRSGANGGTPVCSGQVNASGQFGCSFAAPVAQANNSVPVTVVAGNVSASAPFTVSAAGGGVTVGGNQVGNGTYVVNATREGLVGGTTSSGHVIQSYDRFVSLPACTASSCPWLAPGGNDSFWGTRTECGASCYVRIINPANDQCVVAPVYDVGPWFTLDDYWNPTGSRYLNRLSSNPNVLQQGYPGAQAARSGLDVGYGVAPDGIGISNKGYEVGNSSGIDIGDGSWADLGFNIQGASAGGVTVTMLWQSGEDPNAAARACGQSSANPPAGNGSATPTATAVPPRGTSTPTPTGPRGTSTPTPTTSTATAVPPRMTSTATPVGPRGTSTPTAMPPRGTSTATAIPPRGTSTPTAVSPRGTSTPTPPTGRPTARPPRPTSTPSVRRPRPTSTPTRVTTSSARMSLSSASGASGSLLTVTYAGFRPGERIAVSWDSATGTAAAAVTASSAGNGTVTLRIPSGLSGRHTLVLTGSQSRASASDQFSITGAAPSVRAMAGQPVSGTAASAAAAGLPASYTAIVWWGSQPSVGFPLCRGIVAPDGTFGCSFTLPQGIRANTPYTVTVTAADTATTGRVQFGVSAAEVSAVASNQTPTADATQAATATPAPATATLTLATSTVAPSEEASIPTSTSTDEIVATATAAEPTPTTADEPTTKPTGTPTAVAPAVQGETATSGPSETPGVTPTDTPAIAPTETATEELTETPTVAATEAPTATPVPPRATSTPTATIESTATEGPTVEPTATEEPAPTEEPTPTIITQTLHPLADTSVEIVTDTGTGTPAATDPMAEDPAALPFGGPNSAIAYLSFDVSSVAAPGSIISATLTVTGYGNSGGDGGQLLTLDSVVVDEYGMTYDTRPRGAVEAADANGAPVWLGWIAPGAQTSVDVTGTVSSSGIVTFVLTGDPTTVNVIGSRESGAPPTLTIETVSAP